MTNDENWLGYQRVGGLLHDSFSRVRRLFAADDLLQQGGVLTVATIVAGGLNYVYQIVMGRMLGPEGYGVFGALFGLLYLTSVLYSGVHFGASRFVAELDERSGGAGTFYRGYLLRSVGFGGLVCAALIALSPAIGRFLGLASPWPIVIVATTVPFGLAITVNKGSMQGLQRFSMLASYQIVHAGVKLPVGVGLVVLGYGVYGAFGATVVALAVAVVASSVHLRRGLFERDLQTPEVDYRDVYRYVPPAVLAGLCLTIPTSADVVLVKHLFASADAGRYNAVAVLGRTLTFVPLGISTALFPKVTSEEAADESTRTASLLRRALVYSGAVAGVGTLVFWAAPSLVLETFFGSAYAVSGPLLRWYGLAILPFVLVIVLLNFELARDRMSFVYVATLMSVTEVAAMWLFRGAMVQIVQVMLVANVALFIVGWYEVSR